MALLLIVDAQKVVSDYLRGRPEINALVGRRVVAKTPENRDSAWVQVRRLEASPTALDRADHLTAFLMQFDCYAGNTGGLPEANLLGRTVRAVLGDIHTTFLDEAVLTGCQIVGDASIPDEVGFEAARDRTIITATIWGHAV